MPDRERTTPPSVTDALALPADASFGPYRLGRVLAVRAHTVLLEAQDGPQRVVIKLASSAAAGPAVLRERAIVERLTRLGFAGVSPIRAVGEVDGRPWFAVDFAADGSLADALAEARQRVRVDPGWLGSAAHVGWALGLGRALAAVVARLHGHGVVHADLSPANVLLRAGEPVLADFGESVHGAEPSTPIAASRATPAYCAPERIAGRAFDARADVYALGAILYELLTLAPPFPYDTLEGVFRAQLERAPSAPSTRLPGLPPALDALVLRMLAKPPEERTARACDVERALSMVLGATAAVLPLPSLLHRARWVGPPVLWDRLLALPDRRRAVVLVRGGPGAGKTRLLAELAERARHAGRLVLAAQPGDAYADPGERRPLAALEPLLARVSAQLALEAAHSGEAWSAALAQLAPLDARFAALVPHPLVRPADAGPMARERTFQALLDLAAHALGAQQPLVLIDDLHASDALSQAFVAFVAGREGPLPFELAVSARDAWPLAWPPAALLGQHVLAPLDWHETRELACELLAVADLDSALVDRAFASTHGNPLAIAQWLRTQLRGGRLSWAPGGVRLADEAQVVGAAPLAGLSGDARALAAAAALLGRQFTVADVAALGLLPDAAARAHLHGALDALDAEGELARAEGGRYAFVHEGTRVWLAAGLDPVRARALHAARARLLEGGARGGACDARVGRHWALAGEPVRAARALRGAAEAQRRAGALEEAVVLMGEARQQARLGGGGRRAARIAVALAELYARMARHADLDALGADVLDDAPALYAARLCRTLAVSQRVRGDYGAARGSLARGDAALATLPASSLARERAWIDLRLVALTLAYVQRRPDEARAALAACLPRARLRGTVAQRAALHQAAANAIAARRRYRHSLRAVWHQRRALALLEAGHARDTDLVMARFEVAFAQLSGGARARREAAQLLELAAAQATRLGDHVLLARIATYRAVVARLLHDDALAERWAEEAGRLARACGLNGYVGAAHATLGWVALRRDRRDLARARVQAAHAAWWHGERTPARRHAEYPFQWLAHLPLLALQAVEEDYAGCAATVDELLHPAQAQLPKVLEAALLAVQAAPSPSLAARAVDACLRTALRLRYL